MKAITDAILGNHDRILILDPAEWQYSQALDLCNDGDLHRPPVIHESIQKLIGCDDEPSLRGIRFIRPSPSIHGPLEHFDGGAFLSVSGIKDLPSEHYLSAFKLIGGSL